MWNVLIVNDEAKPTDDLAKVLKGKATCEVQNDAQLALAAFRKGQESKNPHQIILLNVSKPDSPAIEILKSVREIQKAAGIPLHKGIPVILITNDKDSFSQAFNLGCDDYLLKPLDAKKLIRKIGEKVK